MISAAIGGGGEQRPRRLRAGDPRLAVALLLSLALNAAAVLARLDVDGRPGARPAEHRAGAVLSTRTLSAPAQDNASMAPIEAAETSPPSSPAPSVTTSVPQASPPAEAGPSGVQPVKEVATEASSVAPLVAAVPVPPTALPPSPSPDYAKTSELDTSPAPLADITPDYPAAAAFRRGHVVLELFISESGVVDRVDVLSATPPGVFDDSARTAFLQARFEPGRRRGIASKSRMTIEVDYRPADQNGQVSPTRY